MPRLVPVVSLISGLWYVTAAALLLRDKEGLFAAAFGIAGVLLIIGAARMRTSDPAGPRTVMRGTWVALLTVFIPLTAWAATIAVSGGIEHAQLALQHGPLPSALAGAVPAAIVMALVKRRTTP